MILNDLCDLYELKRETSPNEIPERFWCNKQVAWETVISAQGVPLSCTPLLSADGKRPQTLSVPDVQRTSGVRPFFLCDNVEYLLAYDPKKGAQKQQVFGELHNEVLGKLSDIGAMAFLRFVEWCSTAPAHHPMERMFDNPKSLTVFRLKGDDYRIHERQAIHDAWNEYQESLDNGMETGTCLVTGKTAQFAKLFPQVTGLAGAQSSGASLVSCNVVSFSSYGQQTSTAGPISREAADKAGAALSYVLKSPTHRIRVGNDVVAFWTDVANSETDDLFASIFGNLPPQEDAETRAAIQDAITKIRRGRRPLAIPTDTTYHVLGIAPYQARLAVRFYETGTLGELMDNIQAYLQDTEMVNVNHCSLRMILEQVAVQGKAENVPSTLVTATSRALVRGLPFPHALYENVLMRMRADGPKNPWDMGRRAAILRACLLRKERAGKQHSMNALHADDERSLTVALNESNTNEGYLLGRLFALLEKVQIDAVGNTNASIRDRYMGAAATTPVRVFPQLMNLATHHIKKSDFGGLYDRRIQEVIGMMGDSGFPATLSYEDQGRFYIGYYQQKEANYAKREEQ